MFFLANMLSLILLITSFSGLLGNDYTFANLESLQKALILTFLIPILLVRKKQLSLLLPAIAIVLLFILTLINNESLDWISVRRLLGMLIPWLVFAQTWKKAEANFILEIIPKLAVMSVFLGLILTLTNTYDFLVHEYTGAIRLRGAINPPHLAFLAFIGVATASYQAITANKKYMKYVYINLLIIALSLSRMAFVLATMVYLYLLFFHSKRILGNSIINQGAFIGLIFGFSLIIPELLQRTFVETAFGEIFNTSGRLKVWSVFIELGMNQFWLGHGLGFAQQVRDYYLVNNLYVPHNEYINLFYDSGIIGSLIFFIALIIWAFQVASRLKNYKIKMFFAFTFILMMLYAITDNVFNTLQFSLLFTFFIKAILTTNQQKNSMPKNQQSSQNYLPVSAYARGNKC